MEILVSPLALNTQLEAGIRLVQSGLRGENASRIPLSKEASDAFLAYGVRAIDLALKTWKISGVDLNRDIVLKAEKLARKYEFQAETYFSRRLFNIST